MKEAVAAEQQMLVERAKLGEREAFGELVLRHRTRMLQWAENIVHDGDVAEDIVQNALLNMIRHIGRLSEAEKFLPWLRKMVRNEALMALRSDKRIREFPADAHAFDWQAGSEPQSSDPEIRAIGRQALRQMRHLLDRLGPRERKVMDLHVLSGLSAEETAARLGIRTGAVYTALSRARSRLVKERLADETERYLRARKKNDRLACSSIEKARYFRFASAHQTLASAMAVTLAATGIRDVSLSRVMALSGLAFRLQVTEDVGLSGPVSFDWAEAGRKGWQNLGFSCRVFGGPGMQPTDPEEWVTAMDGMMTSIENGVPVTVWHASGAEFGIVTGYDDRQRSWRVTDTSAVGRRMPYANPGATREKGEWFVLVPQITRSSAGGSALCDPLPAVLSDAVAHMRGVRGGIRRETAVRVLEGADGYRAWTEALSAKTLTDPLAAAYNAAVTAEARNHAVRFLHEETGRLEAERSRAVPAVAHAEHLYRQVARAWSGLAALFPFPSAGNPTKPGPAERAQRLLEQAAEAERRAADTMEEACAVLAREKFFDQNVRNGPYPASI